MARDRRHISQTFNHGIKLVGTGNGSYIRFAAVSLSRGRRTVLRDVQIAPIGNSTFDGGTSKYPQYDLFGDLKVWQCDAGAIARAVIASVTAGDQAYPLSWESAASNITNDADATANIVIPVRQDIDDRVPFSGLPNLPSARSLPLLLRDLSGGDSYKLAYTRHALDSTARLLTRVPVGSRPTRLPEIDIDPTVDFLLLGSFDDLAATETHATAFNRDLCGLFTCTLEEY